MNFTPKTDKELAEQNLLPEGVYDFEVMDAKDQRSKAGNEMIAIKLRLWASDGSERHVYDYLMESMAFKLKHFADVSGLSTQYAAGRLSAQDCLNGSGKLKLIIKKDKTGQYADQNAVKDYVTEKKEIAPAPSNNEAPVEDDVPF